MDPFGFIGVAPRYIPAGAVSELAGIRLSCWGYPRTYERGALPHAEVPGNNMGLATGTSAGLRAGHDVCRAPGSAARWGRAGRKLADARGRCDLLRGR